MGFKKQEQNQSISPYFPPEQMQQWQSYGMPPQQITPELMQYLQQQGIQPQQVTPEMLEQWQYQLYQWQMQQMQIQQMQSIDPMPPMQPMQMQPPYPQDRDDGGWEPRRRFRFGRFLAVLMVLGVLGGGIWYFFNNYKGSAISTAVIEMSEWGTPHRGDALIVRQETAFEEEGVQSIDYVAQEGSLVYKGNVVCYVYSTGYSSKEMQTLQNYRDQIKDYQRTLLKSQAQVDTKMDRLEAEVIQRGLEVRNLVQGARGSMMNQEAILANAITQRQNYFRSENPSDMRLARLYDDEDTQQQRIYSWIKQEHATRQSIVSFYTDGFEQALSPLDLEKYTPTEVRAMINGQRPEVSTAARGRTSIYRLVTETNYAVLMLIKDNTWNPVQGSEHKLRLEQFSNTVVDAKIVSFTRSGGELLLRLAVVGDVTPVLYMRTCQAELGEYVDCMRVPSSAIYEQSGSKGVVLMEGGDQVFVPVDIVQESGGMAYISPIQTGVLSEGQTVRLFR